MKLKHILGLLCAASISILVAGSASAQDKTVKIGAIYPLSGNAASAGNYSKAAIEAGARHHQQRASRARATSRSRRARACRPRRRQDRGGLRRQPGHAGGRPEPGAAADHRGEGGGADRRLPVGHHGDRQRHRRATRHSVPERRNRWRPTSPSAASSGSSAPRRWPSTSPAPIRLPQGAEGGRARRSASSRWCTRTPSTATRSPASSRSEFGKDGRNVAQEIAYSANSTDVQPQVLQLKEKNPDVVIFISYTSDAILYAKTMKDARTGSRRS